MPLVRLMSWLYSLVTLDSERFSSSCWRWGLGAGCRQASSVLDGVWAVLNCCITGIGFFFDFVDTSVTGSFTFALYVPCFKRYLHFVTFSEMYKVSCTRLRILLNTICRKPGFNTLRTPLNHGAEQASNETLKQTQQRNWSNASQGGQTALKEHLAVLHFETAGTTHQPRGEHRGTIKGCKSAGATTWQGQGNHTFTTQGNSVCIFKIQQQQCYFSQANRNTVYFRDS